MNTGRLPGTDRPLFSGLLPDLPTTQELPRGGSKRPTSNPGCRPLGTADFSYGVISNTTPQPPVQADPVPPVEAVPYRLPLLSNTRLLCGYDPSLPLKS